MAGNIEIKKADIFHSEAQTLVNTVNCVGVMGKGLALEFKQRFPEMFKDYEARCARGEVQLGKPHLYRGLFPPWILNFPTKDHWRSVSRLEDIVNGLNYLKNHYKKWGMTSIAVPALGSSHGQLDWKVVGPTMYRILSEFEIPIELYVPLSESVEDFEKLLAGKTLDSPENDSLLRIKPAWVALVAVLAELEKEPYRSPLGRTMFQKVAYFATMSGLPTGLNYRRGSYGPFADELKAIITRLVNNGLIEERALKQKMFEVRVGPAYRDASQRFANDLHNWSSIIKRVADLFARVNTQQAEVMATVHKAAHDLGRRIGRKPSSSEVTEEVLAWKQKRRPPLNQKMIENAVSALAMLGWIEIEAGEDLVIEEPELV
jgi:O-acetyl-ADP-ribose deacetylase (regulator of RNase III)/uncharacterized protein YwgA